MPACLCEDFCNLPADFSYDVFERSFGFEKWHYGRNAAMSNNLLIAYVSHFDDFDDALRVRIRGGSGYRRFPVMDVSDYCEGDVVVIDQDAGDVERAADEVWDELSWLGVVRIKTDTIISEGSLLRLVPTREYLEYEVGNTVKVRDDFGVVAVLSTEPVDALDSLREIFGEEDFAAQFRIEPSANGPSYDDFAGYDELKIRVRDFIRISLHRRKALIELGARPGKGALFTGNPGTGKIFLARIVANQEGQPSTRCGDRRWSASTTGRRKRCLGPSSMTRRGRRRPSSTSTCWTA